MLIGSKKHYCMSHNKMRVKMLLINPFSTPSCHTCPRIYNSAAPIRSI